MKNTQLLNIYLNNMQNVTFLFEQEAESISWFKMKNASDKCVLLIGDSPTSVYIGRHVIHVMKWTRPSTFGFAYCKLSETGWWEGLGTRLSLGYRYNLCDCLSCRILFRESRRRFAMKTWYTKQSFVLLPVSQCYRWFSWGGGFTS